jgi:hypothetical protein
MTLLVTLINMPFQMLLDTIFEEVLLCPTSSELSLIEKKISKVKKIVINTGRRASEMGRRLSAAAAQKMAESTKKLQRRLFQSVYRVPPDLLAQRQDAVNAARDTRSSLNRRATSIKRLMKSKTMIRRNDIVAVQVDQLVEQITIFRGKIENEEQLADFDAEWSRYLSVSISEDHIGKFTALPPFLVFRENKAKLEERLAKVEKEYNERWEEMKNMLNLSKGALLMKLFMLEMVDPDSPQVSTNSIQPFL